VSRVAIDGLDPCARCGHTPRHVRAHWDASEPLAVAVEIACKCGARLFPFDMSEAPMLEDTRVAGMWNDYQAAVRKARE
jgi:hypothetical protein